MNRFLTTALLITSLGLTACSVQNPSSPESVSPPSQQSEKATVVAKSRPAGIPIGRHLHSNMEALGRQTFQNAYKLERAVWKFAAENKWSKSPTSPETQILLEKPYTITSPVSYRLSILGRDCDRSLDTEWPDTVAR